MGVIFPRNFITKHNYFSLNPRSPLFWLFSLHSVNTLKNKKQGRPGNEANFFVENLIVTRKFDCSRFQGVKWLPLSVTPQSLTPRSSDFPGSVAFWKWLLPTVGKCRYMERELVWMFNFAHTEYSTYYTISILGKELGNEYIATEAEALKEESVAFVAEIISRLMCWNVALLQQGVQFVRNDKNHWILTRNLCNSMSGKNSWPQWYFLS